MRKSTAEKIAEVQAKKQQLENEQKRLLQQQKAEERKARTKRLCFRGGAVEKLLPELITLTDEQFDVFLNTVILSEQTKRVLADITAQKPLQFAPKHSNATAHRNDSTADGIERGEGEGEAF